LFVFCHRTRPVDTACGIPRPARFRYSNGTDLIFEIRDAEESGYCARVLGHAIFTQADSWDELRGNVLSPHFEDAEERPRMVQLHHVQHELIPVEAA